MKTTKQNWSAIADTVEEIKDHSLWQQHQQMVNCESPQEYCQIAESIYFSNQNFNRFYNVCEQLSRVERENYHLVKDLEKLSIGDLWDDITNTQGELEHIHELMYFAIEAHIHILRGYKQTIFGNENEHFSKKPELLTA